MTPRIALFIKLTPKSFWSGVSAVGITSNTRDMTLPGHPGVTFRSAPGVVPSVVEQALDETATLELQGIYSTGILEREDVVAGKWHFATIEVFSACWDNTNLGELLHFKGNVGEVKDFQSHFIAEGRGMIGRLSDDVNMVTSRTCRVKEFRDSQCGHVAATVTIGANTWDVVYTGIIATDDTLNDGHTIQFGSSVAPPSAGTLPVGSSDDGLFTNGKITATSGANNGVSREIAGADELEGYLIFLKRKFPFPVTMGDTFTLVAGCRRTIEDCKKFGNAINFRGEPFVPGLEVMNRISTAN